MEKFRCIQRDNLHYYNPERKNSNDEEFWLLVPFVNQWFNLIDLRKVKSEVEYLNPYKRLQIRWIYTEPPQKIFQSTYKATLDKNDFKWWTEHVIPDFENLTAQCHCQKEFQNKTRCQNYLASGNLEIIILNPILLDRLQRGPMFRETTNGDLNLARSALKEALQELFDRNKKPEANKWIKNFLKAFDSKAQELTAQDQKGEINLQELLFPAPGKISEHQKDLDAFLEKYVILPADKCRGNYYVICKNLYIKQCVESLHQAPEYQILDISKDELTAQLVQEISGLVHHSHLDLLLDEGRANHTFTLCQSHTRIQWGGARLQPPTVQF
jgi:hypothetical protein